MKIQGKITEGIRVATDFTQIPWVKNQCLSKLSIDVFPGTLNLDIGDKEGLRLLEDLKTSEGIELTPEDPSFCSAKCHPILIAGKIQGAVIIPLVDDYPKNKLELIASVHIKDTLSVDTGDDLEIEVL